MWPRKLFTKVISSSSAHKSEKGTSIIEYVVLVMLVLGALYVMQNTIKGGLFGKQKIAGDSFAFGRQYDAKRTTVCKQDYSYNSTDGTPVPGVVYDEDCFKTRVMRNTVSCSAGDCGCVVGYHSGCAQGDFACEDCIKQSCSSDYCSKLTNEEI